MALVREPAEYSCNTSTYFIQVDTQWRDETNYKFILRGQLIDALMIPFHRLSRDSYDSRRTG